MARKLLALIAKLRSSDDAVFASRLASLADSATPSRLQGRLSPFRFVAPRSAL